MWKAFGKTIVGSLRHKTLQRSTSVIRRSYKVSILRRDDSDDRPQMTHKKLLLFTHRWRHKSLDKTYSTTNIVSADVNGRVTIVFSEQNWLPSKGFCSFDSWSNLRKVGRSARPLQAVLSCVEHLFAPTLSVRARDSWGYAFIGL